MRIVALLFAAVLLLPTHANGQGVPRLDSPYMTPVSGAGKALIYWVTDEGANGESTEGFSYKYRFEQAWTDELPAKSP